LQILSRNHHRWNQLIFCKLKNWLGLGKMLRLDRLSKLLNEFEDGVYAISEMRGERLQVMLSPEELAALDDFRFKHRMPTRAAAVRELLKFGLAAVGVEGSAGVKSSDYGVFSRGPEGHRSAKDSPGTE
jgi:hypothetical protein